MDQTVIIIYVLLAAFVFITTCNATTYTVGDTSGWDISTNLDAWTNDKKFTVGDVLVFQYSSSHSVSEVNQENFNNCNTSNPLKTYANGNSTVSLTKAGGRYFVCGNKLHCFGGMKLQVHVDDNRTYSPAAAPKAVAGSFSQVHGESLPRPSSKSNNVHNSAGHVNCASDNIANLIALIVFWFTISVYVANLI
ncbi:Blue copper protein [Quillaja saponaria]|uniref:Blue copper protein n=1 Tax=Quillaja saponaria TaxID=32244 RepID=A0AAD7Q4P7_QUISA|nr:Blue copper protein [Quillaja saponaria]